MMIHIQSYTNIMICKKKCMYIIYVYVYDITCITYVTYITYINYC